MNDVSPSFPQNASPSRHECETSEPPSAQPLTSREREREREGGIEREGERERGRERETERERDRKRFCLP